MTAPDLEWPSNAWLTYADVTKRWGLQTDPKTRNYVAVTPDTITLPRAEVKALMAAAIGRDGGVHDADCKSIRYINGFCNCGRDDVLAALAALQERMK